MFELQYIGHAGWLVKNKNFKVLCDPWFGPPGGYFGQWYPFPKNSHLLTDELLEDLDFIYISHAHEDLTTGQAIDKRNVCLRVQRVNND